MLDSLQTVTCTALKRKAQATPRDVVEANVAAFRHATQEYKLLGFATSEANRAAYREGGNGSQDALAAGAESRSIEFSAQTLLFLTADPKLPDVTQVNVRKNRALGRGEFALRLDRERHAFVEVDLAALKAQARAKQQAKLRDAGESFNAASAVAVAREILKQPGIGTNALHEALRAEHGTFSEDRATTALAYLGAGLVRLDGPNRAKRHYLHGQHLPGDVLAELPAARDARPPEGAPHA